MLKTIRKSCRRQLFPCILLLAIIPLFSKAQYRYYDDEELDPQGKYEFGLQLGANAFLGDLGGKLGVGKNFAKDYVFKTARPLAGISFNYYPRSWYSIIGGLNFTSVMGADSLINNKNGAERWRYNRNLSFKSFIWEAYVGAEVFPLPLINQDFTAGRLRPYIGAGVGMFHFNPKTKYGNQWIDLQPLHLEGQNFAEYPDRHEYSLYQFYIPVTAGVRFVINPQFSISSGFIFRYTFTDYIN